MLDGVVEVLQRRRTAPIGDRGMIVSVVSWVLLVATIFTLLTRLAMKLALSKTPHKFGLDDLFIAFAAICSIGQTAAVSMEAVHALGQHRDALGAIQIERYQKSEYAACMLFIANLGLSRISICFLIKKILPGRLARVAAIGFAGFSFLWFLTGVLASAFPCKLPRTWDFRSGGCYDGVKFVNYIGISNIVVEVLLVLIPIFVWNLRLSAVRGMSVSLMFLSRLSVVAAVACQLIFFNRYSHSRDFTYDYWRTTLCVQIAQNLSIITACLPCLHPFILSILSGTTKTNDLVFKCKQKKRIEKMLNKSKYFDFDSNRSSSGTICLKEKDPEAYVAPLATWGLTDRSSAHLNSQQLNRFPSEIPSDVSPIEGPTPPENVFNRSIALPAARPLSGESQKDLPPLPPKRLSDVGIIPIIDWDSSDTGSGRSSPSRRRDSDYVFSREKVISVPEGGQLYEEDYWRRYPPPPER